MDNQLQLVEGEDYYVEDGYYVFTAAYLLKRGYCCGSGCRHCPYPAGENSSPKAGANSTNTGKKE